MDNLITIETHISSGYIQLLDTFFIANDLHVKFDTSNGWIVLSYEDGSDTAYKITFMSVRHLGFENMLCSYLEKCGIPLQMISYGKYTPKRDLDKVEKDWMEYRKKIGLGRY